jgi:hypothetical protein
MCLETNEEHGYGCLERFRICKRIATRFLVTERRRYITPSGLGVLPEGFRVFAPFTEEPSYSTRMDEVPVQRQG